MPSVLSSLKSFYIEKEKDNGRDKNLYIIDELSSMEGKCCIIL